MNYSLLEPKILIDRFESLPDDIKDALSHPSDVEIVAQICRNNFLDDDEKILVVAQLTSLVLMGFLLPEELAREISNNIHLNLKAAQAIAEEIDRKIFSPFQNELGKIYSPLKETGATVSAPTVSAAEVTPEKSSVTMMPAGPAAEAEKKLKGAAIQEKITILKQAATAGFVADIPNLEAHLKENEFKLYNEEKTYQDIADRSGFSLKGLVDQKKASATGGGKATEEVAQKITAYFKRLPSPGELDSFFKDFSTARIFPFGTDQGSAKEMQKEIVHGVISGFSPEVMANFFLKLVKKDRLENFERVAIEMGLRKEDFAPDNLRWLQNQAAGSVGVSLKTFGIK